MKRQSYRKWNRARIFLSAVLGVILWSFLFSPVVHSATWSNTYDVMDRLSGRTDPLGRSEKYAYDLAGNLTQFTDRKGQVTTFTYDPLNRLTSLTYADNSSITISYDSIGRPVSLVDSISGRIDLAYDVLNRLVRETTALGSVLYTYDVLGRRTSMAVNGITVTYTYDAAARLTQVTQGNQTVTMAYDAKGRRTILRYPNGTTTAYNYDAADRLTGMFHANGTMSFESIAYGYDASGNRTAVVRGSNPATFLPVTVQASYDAANEQVSFNSSTPNQTYDANGNLVSRTDSTGTTTYTWDARDRLIAVNGPNLTASFVYDALNRRISKTINDVTTQYLYDRKNVVQEISSGTVSATYLRSLNVDEPFVRLLNFTNTVEFYHLDALGTTLVLTDARGTVQTTYSYTSFGETTVNGTSSTNPFQLSGRENDGTGLYYYRARYYSPKLKRFISEDPIGFASGGTNLYGYVDNKPLDFIDPSGFTFQSNWNFFWDWSLGVGPRVRNYGPNDIETQEMMASMGAQMLRDQFYGSGCKNTSNVNYGTGQAYWDTLGNPFTADPFSTAAQVGGFGGASATNNGNGTVTFNISNVAGTKSFFYHILPNRSSPTGPMSNIVQNFQWTEPIGGRKDGCQ